ncbi:MAG: hypothetical protein LBI37_01295 [Puniceicoccales bacterium]|jgi:DNA phosphorothioation-dependent restriction protein DptG|nr:hypothetical protein [Puniceicoccales bacterium]
MKHGLLFVWICVLIGVNQLDAGYDSTYEDEEYYEEINDIDEDEGSDTANELATSITDLVKSEVEKQDLFKKLDKHEDEANSIEEVLDELYDEQDAIKTELVTHIDNIAD